MTLSWTFPCNADKIMGMVCRCATTILKHVESDRKVTHVLLDPPTRFALPARYEKIRHDS